MIHILRIRSRIKFQTNICFLFLFLFLKTGCLKLLEPSFLEHVRACFLGHDQGTETSSLEAFCRKQLEICLPCQYIPWACYTVWRESSLGSRPFCMDSTYTHSLYPLAVCISITVYIYLYDHLCLKKQYEQTEAS